MLAQSVLPEVIAAHEAGHVVVARHLSLKPIGVRLLPEGSSPAGTRFEDGVLDAIPKDHRFLLAFSGLAGQIFAPTNWEFVHAQGDVRWLLKDWNAGEDWPSGDCREVLLVHEELFDVVRHRILAGLEEGERFLSREQLLEQGS